MPDQKKPYSKPQVADNPIAEVFEGRHPSESEAQWAEKTLAPTIEKSPEKPIGAPTGRNLDEHGQARFTTISGVPIRRLYTHADLPEDWNEEQYLGYPGRSRPIRAAFTPPGYRGKLLTMRSSRALPLPRKPTSGTSICWNTAAEACRLHSTCPR